MAAAALLHDLFPRPKSLWVNLGCPNLLLPARLKKEKDKRKVRTRQMKGIKENTS